VKRQRQSPLLRRAVPPYGGDAPLLGGAGAASAGLGAPGGGEGGGKFSVFNLKRYRMYFNVDTQARAQPGKLFHRRSMPLAH